jgi:hypothetical protein
LGAKDRAGFAQQKHRVSADKLTLASVVDHIGKAVAAHGNYVADRWEGRTDRELNLLVTVSPVKPGGFRVRWQYRDAVGDLYQKQQDLFAWEESSLPSLGFELVRANSLATAFQNPHSEPQEGGDPLHRLLKETRASMAINHLVTR